VLAFFQKLPPHRLAPAAAIVLLATGAPVLANRQVTETERVKVLLR
jgi:hypothetical protein